MSDAVTEVAPQPDADAGVAGSRVVDFLSRYLLLGLLVAIFVGFSIGVSDSFFTTDNYRSIINDQIVVVFLAIAVTIPLIVGEFDVSVGYVLGLTQALAVGLLVRHDISIPVVIVLVLIIAAGVGVVNGVLVVYLKMHSFITTLATGSILTGFVYWYTQGQVLFEGVPDAYPKIARDELWGIPLPVLYGLVLTAAAALYLTYWPTGRRMYSTGGNRSAATLSGVRVNRLVLGSFVVSAVLAGAGVIISSQYSSASPSLGPQFLLPAFAAAFLGATAFTPGRFNVLGAVVGVYVLAAPISGLQQLGVPSWFEYVFYGGALIIAVGLSGEARRLRQQRARRQRLRAFDLSREVTSVDVGDTTSIASPPRKENES
jgi:ribose transport system permease protein